MNLAAAVIVVLGLEFSACHLSTPRPAAFTAANQTVVLNHHEGAVTSMAWSPGGDTLATTSVDGAARLWKVDGGEVSRVILWNSDGAIIDENGRAGLREAEVFPGLAWSPDGRLVAVGALATVKIWASDNGELLHTLPEEGEAKAEIRSDLGLPPLAPYTAVAWSAEGALVASAKGYGIRTTGEISVWDPMERVLLLTIRADQSVKALAWAPGTMLLASVGERVDLWDVRPEAPWRVAAEAKVNVDREVLPGLFQMRDDPGLSEAERRALDELIKTTEIDIEPRYGTISSGDRVRVFQTDSLAASLAWSPDGALLAVGTRGAEATINVWAVETGELVRAMSGHVVAVDALSWSADGSRLASAGADGAVKVWNARTGSLLSSVEHDRRVTAIAWSPDGRMLASGLIDGTVIVDRDARSPDSNR